MCELLVRTELACMLSAGSTKEGFVVLVKFAHVDLQTLFSKAVFATHRTHRISRITQLLERLCDTLFNR